WGYQIEMDFNPEVLHGVSVDDGGFLASAGGNVAEAPGMGFDNVNGKLNLFAAFLFPKENFPTGGGPLAFITFEVVGIGGSPLNLGVNTGLANKTGGWELGPDWEPILKGANPDIFTDGYFDNRFTIADISADPVRRSAWPEHHHYVISKDEDDYQTINAKVKNLGVIDVYVKVTFEVSKDGADPTTYETPTEFMTPGEMRNLFHNLPMTTGNEGKYTVTARCQYSPDGDYWFLGEKTKTFGFAVVP
ncbi:MAG: cohesin domain-containing protein, partial [Candidatus Bathyarchaeota archaeon]|nr:cohesin domain-containing protein [Candidatus Bathyarchaeota archaeon]